MDRNINGSVPDEVSTRRPDPKFILACPNFRNAPQTNTQPAQETVGNGASNTVLITLPDARRPKTEEEEMGDTYPLLVLRFFRDISPAQRMSILASLDALPPNWTERLSESFERKALDRLIEAGRSDELWSALRAIVRE